MKLLTLDEASGITRLPVATLRYLRHRGEGPPFFRLTRRVVVKESDLYTWIEQRSQADAGRRCDGMSSVRRTAGTQGA